VLKLELGTMLFQLVAFLVLMGLMIRYALRPVMGVMEKRQAYIDEQINTAEKNRAEAERLVAEQREELEKARKEPRELLERAKAQKEREAEAIIKEAQERAERMIQEASKEIAREKEKALAELRDQVGQLTVLLASKVLEKEVDAKQQSKLVDRYLQQVGELQ
jgi:F-type H+-transporting ATPase subunit b